eukprot:328615-Chlamydomonas_euryale.AAC.2
MSVLEDQRGEERQTRHRTPCTPARGGQTDEPPQTLHTSERTNRRAAAGLAHQREEYRQTSRRRPCTPARG